VGFRSGSILRFDPDTGAVTTLSFLGAPVSRLATNETGDFLAALHREGAQGVLRSHGLRPHGFWVLLQNRHVGEATGLTPLTSRGGEPVGGIWDRERLTLLSGQLLLPFGEVDFGVTSQATPPVHLALVPLAESRSSPFHFLVFHGDGELELLGPGGKALAEVLLGQRTECQLDMRIWDPREKATLEVAFVNRAEGRLHWAEVRLGGGQLQRVGARSRVGGYWAVALCGRGRLAVVGPGVAEGWRWSSGGWSAWFGPLLVDSREIFACFHSPSTGEILIVCQGGDLLRVPVPR
jgi:hypothetical protein